MEEWLRGRANIIFANRSDGLYPYTQPHQPQGYMFQDYQSSDTQKRVQFVMQWRLGIISSTARQPARMMRMQYITFVVDKNFIPAVRCGREEVGEEAAYNLLYDETPWSR